MSAGAVLALAALAVLAGAVAVMRRRRLVGAPAKLVRADRVTQDTIDAASVKAQAQLLTAQIRANLARVSENVDIWPGDQPPPNFIAPELPPELQEERRGRI